MEWPISSVKQTHILWCVMFGYSDDLHNGRDGWLMTRWGFADCSLRLLGPVGKIEFANECFNLLRHNYSFFLAPKSTQFSDLCLGKIQIFNYLHTEHLQKKLRFATSFQLSFLVVFHIDPVFSRQETWPSDRVRISLNTTFCGVKRWVHVAICMGYTQL